MSTGVKVLIRRYIEDVWNRADAAALVNLTTAGFRYYLGGHPGRDRDAMQQFLVMTHAAFPDWRVEIVDIVAQEDTVAVRWKGEVTHEGAFHAIPPTGRRITVTGINMYRIVGGKIDAEWEQTDSLGMLQQLGVLPQG